MLGLFLSLATLLQLLGRLLQQLVGLKLRVDRHSCACKGRPYQRSEQHLLGGLSRTKRITWIDYLEDHPCPNAESEGRNQAMPSASQQSHEHRRNRVGEQDRRIGPTRPDCGVDQLQIGQECDDHRRCLHGSTPPKEQKAETHKQVANSDIQVGEKIVGVLEVAHQDHQHAGRTRDQAADQHQAGLSDRNGIPIQLAI